MGKGGESNRILKCETGEGLKGKLIAIIMLFDLLNLAQGRRGGGGVLDPKGPELVIFNLGENLTGLSLISYRESSVNRKT